MTEDSRPWYLGAIGELRVAEQLAKLGPDWTVLHSVPIGDRGSDIDHVVLGSAGVFTINTKYHEDARVWVGGSRMLVNGQKTDHLRNSRFEAQRVARDLSAATGVPIEVHAAIVIVGARSITGREQPADVAVLRDTELVRWLRRRRAVVDADTHARLAATLTRRETWVAPSVPAGDVDLVAFAALRREVAAARRVRMLWGTALLVGAIAVVGALAVNGYAMLVGG